jgi:hypothetical protein
VPEPAEREPAAAIACTLGTDEVPARLEAWRAVLARTVADRDRPRPRTLRLRLRDDVSDLGPVVDLARREQACCAFFRFRLEIEAAAVTLVVEVPDGAEAALDAFAGLSA